MALIGRAKIFRHGGSQAIRIPRAFHMSGTEAEITRSPSGGLVLDPMEMGIETRQRRFRELTGAAPHLLHTAPAIQRRSGDCSLAYLPDAATVDAFLRGKDLALAEKLAQAFGSLSLSAIVLAECEFIASRATNALTRVKLRELTQLIPVLPFTQQDSASCGAIRHELNSKGVAGDILNAQLAAQAVRIGAIVIAANPADFTSIPGVKVERWLS